MVRDQYQAVVEKIIRDGRHGPYAVATAPTIGTITFSLQPPVWQDADWPETGMYVVLQQIRKKRAGWRALRARFVSPEDQQLA